MDASSALAKEDAFASVTFRERRALPLFQTGGRVRPFNTQYNGRTRKTPIKVCSLLPRGNFGSHLPNCDVSIHK